MNEWRVGALLLSEEIRGWRSGKNCSSNEILKDEFPPLEFRL
jgi:hypothetical protein